MIRRSGSWEETVARLEFYGPVDAEDIHTKSFALSSNFHALFIDICS